MYNPHIKAEGVWVHPELGYTSTDKKDGYVFFSSKAELGAWNKLKYLFGVHGFTISRQCKVTSGTLSWKIDFRIDAYEPRQQRVLAQISKLLCPNSGYNVLPSLYIEYKGYQDSNFMKKFTEITNHAPMLTRSIVLCSNRAEGYVKEDKIAHTIYMHPIVSLDYLESVALSSIRAILK